LQQIRNGLTYEFEGTEWEDEDELYDLEECPDHNQGVDQIELFDTRQMFRSDELDGETSA